MKRNFTRLISMLLSLIMLLGVVSLVACNGTGTPAATETPGSSEETPGSSEGTPDASTPDSSETDPGENEPAYTQPEWLTSFDEKIAALGNFYGRTMSAAWGGYSANYPAGSIPAIEEAIALGIDAIAIKIEKTTDGVYVAVPAEGANAFVDLTDFWDKKGNNGLPSLGKISSWTYEQLCQLKLKNADGSVSEYILPTFDDVVKACAGKCFVYICNDPDGKNYNEMINGIVYETAKKYNAYASMMVTPGAAAIAEWVGLYADDTALASFVESTVKPTYYKLDKYFENRMPYDIGVTHKNIASSGYDESWSPVADNAEGWETAVKARHTFIFTADVAGFTKYVATNNKSALEYQPNQWDVTEYSIAKEDLTGRYMMISDIHYAAAEIPASFVNRDKYRGWTNAERLEKMCDDIRAEYEQRGLDAIFVLGDISTDDPPHKTYLGRFAEKLWKEYLLPLSEELNDLPIFVIGGNHDGYSNNIWKKYFGMERQYSWVNPRNGDVFIMCDTFDPARGENKDGSGISWTDIDAEWLKGELAKHKDAPNIFIGSHWFGKGEGQLDAISTCVNGYTNVRCLFDAHSHHYAGLQKYDGLGPGIINTGSFSYADTTYTYIANGPGGSKEYYNFDFHDMDDTWGYQMVETAKDGTVVTYRIDVEAWYVATAKPKNEATYTGQWGYVDYVPYTKYNEIVLKTAN